MRAALATPLFFLVSSAAFAGLNYLNLSAEINAGLSSISNATASATDSLGSSYGFLAMGSVGLKSWELDAGLGILTSAISGSAQPSGFGLTHYDLQMSAGVAEISPQYKLSDRVLMGPVADFLFGPDVGFSPQLGGSGETTAVFGGAQALYAFSCGKFPVKLGGRFLESLSIPSRQVQSLQATLQFGLPII